MKDLYAKFRLDILRAVGSAEEAQKLAQNLAEINWNEAIALDRSTRKQGCSNCHRRTLISDLIPVSNKLEGRYCLHCRVFCPACKVIHVKEQYQWLYPLCETCCKKVDRSRLTLEARKVKIQIKRASVLHLPASLTLGEWIGTLENFSWHCAYCLVAPYEHCDHYLPLTHQGGTTQSNCVPACRSCNFLKSQYHPNQVANIPFEAMQRVKQYLMQF